MASKPAVTPQEALAGFASQLAIYEHRIGQACRKVAAHLPTLLTSLPPNPQVLDNACGTGAVTEELLKVRPDAQISAADITPPMIELFRAQLKTSPLLSAQVKDLRAEDGQALTYPDNTFDASITNFGIFFFPDPVSGAKHIYRTLKPGRTAILTLWKTFGFKPILWEVQDRVKPLNPLTELPLMEPWCDPAKLEGVLKDGGFQEVEFHFVSVGLWGEDKEDFKKVMVENFVMMVARSWSEEEARRIPTVTSEVVDEMEGQFCVRDGERVGCMMEALVAVCVK